MRISDWSSDVCSSDLIGGGGRAPVEQSILADTFPPEKRGMGFAAFAIVVVVGPVFGPTLGGYITEHSSWHWIFLINVPVGIAALVLVEIFVDEPEQIRRDRATLLKRGLRIDYIGVILIFLGLGFLEITMDRGERDRKSTRLNSRHYCEARMPSSACKK